MGRVRTISKLAVGILWAARVTAVLVSVVVTVFVGYVSQHDSMVTSRVYGGLSACFYCSNGWNWHVLFFTLAFSVGITESIISKRNPILIKERHKQRMVHIAWHTVSLILSIAGIVSVIFAKLQAKRLHMNSLHGFCGAVVFFLFSAQYFWSTAVYLILPKRYSSGFRRVMARWHPIVGQLIFYGGIETCVNGFVLMQKVYVQYGEKTYGNALIFETVAGLLFWILAGLIFIERSLPRHHRGNVSSGGTTGGGCGGGAGGGVVPPLPGSDVSQQEMAISLPKTLTDGCSSVDTSAQSSQDFGASSFCSESVLDLESLDRR